MLGDGAGTFANAGNVTVAFGPTALNLSDINNDGNEDVYSILISNGKVIAAKAYIIKENSHELISTEEVVNLLNSNNGFQNLLLISQIGNHGENEVKSNSDLFNVTKE